MREEIMDKYSEIARLTLVSMASVAMNHVLVLVVATTISLFVLGTLFVSVLVGLLMAMVGSMVVLYSYVMFCQGFADQRGRRQA